jgi:hypothetical protein
MDVLRAMNAMYYKAFMGTSVHIPNVFGSSNRMIRAAAAAGTLAQHKNAQGE